MKKLTDNQSLALSIAGALLATFGFGFLLSVAPSLTQAPLPTATPGGIPVSKYQQQVPDFTLTDQDGGAGPPGGGGRGAAVVWRGGGQ